MILNMLGKELGLIFDNNTASALGGWFATCLSKRRQQVPRTHRSSNVAYGIARRTVQRFTENYNLSWPMLKKVDEIYARYISQRTESTITQT